MPAKRFCIICGVLLEPEETQNTHAECRCARPATVRGVSASTYNLYIDRDYQSRCDTCQHAAQCRAGTNDLLDLPCFTVNRVVEKDEQEERDEEITEYVSYV